MLAEILEFEQREGAGWGSPIGIGLKGVKAQE
jgi:hypothetical protein